MSCLARLVPAGSDSPATCPHRWATDTTPRMAAIRQGADVGRNILIPVVSGEIPLQGFATGSFHGRAKGPADANHI